MERDQRGPYGGAVAYFGFSGNLDSCITIRTVVLTGDRAYVQAGAGIVYDSDPGRGTDDAQHGELSPPIGLVRLRDKRGIQKQEADHHLDGAVTPQRGNDVAAQRLSKCPADFFDFFVPAPPQGFAVPAIAQGGGDLTRGHLDPARDPH